MREPENPDKILKGGIASAPTRAIACKTFKSQLGFFLSFYGGWWGIRPFTCRKIIHL
jgi:hypothetical protein